MSRARNVLLLLCLAVLVFSSAAWAQTGFPREETLIVNMLTGWVGTPSNFNWWVGWRWSDRGLQNIVSEPLWSVDFATGQDVYKRQPWSKAQRRSPKRWQICNPPGSRGAS